MTRILCLLTLYLGTALGQVSLYTYMQTEPGKPWQWGRLIIPPHFALAPAAGKPCNGTEPCYTVSFTALGVVPPGTTNERQWFSCMTQTTKDVTEDHLFWVRGKLFDPGDGTDAFPAQWLVLDTGIACVPNKNP